MSWPSPQDYNESIQTPNVSFEDPELRAGKPALNALGLPMPMTGAFASVYRFKCKKRDVAVRCFLQGFSDCQRRYSQISKYIMNDDLSYTVDFEYLENGIRVNGRWYPILKMDWVEGIPLDRYIDQFCSHAQKMSELLIKFLWMMEDLRAAGIAHGDLQHGNILVCGDELRLVDYDGMYVPELAGWTSHEVGHRNYQHPWRGPDNFGPELDRFASWVIATCLHALCVDGELWHKNMAGDDCLLFKQADLKEPDGSRIFQILLNHQDQGVRNCARLLKEMRNYSLEQLPDLASPQETPEVLERLLKVEPVVRTPVQSPVTRRSASSSSNSSSERWWESSAAEQRPQVDVSSLWKSAQKAMDDCNYRDAVGFLSQLISGQNKAASVNARLMRAKAYLALGRGVDAAEDSEHFAHLILQKNAEGELEYCQVRARALLAAFRWDQAEIVVQNAWIRLQPESHEAKLALAKCLFAKRKYKNVVDMINEHFKAQGLDYDLCIMRAEAKIKLNQTPGAKTDLAAAIKSCSSRHEAYLMLARLDMDNAHFVMAEAEFTQALALHKDARIFFDRGRARQQQSKFEEAKADFGEAARMAPSQILREQSFEQMGICLFEQQDYVQTIEALKNASLSRGVDQLTSKGQVAYHAARGYLELEAGEYSKARDSFEKADKVSVMFDVHISLGLGLASAKQKKAKQALKFFKKCANVVNDTRMKCRIASALLDLEQVVEAAEWVESTLAIEPNNAKTLLLAAEIARRRGRWKEALAACLKAQELDPREPGAALLLGRILENHGKFAEAAAEYRRSVSSGAREEACVRLAHIALRRGQLEQALIEFDKAAILGQSKHLEGALAPAVLYVNAMFGDSTEKALVTGKVQETVKSIKERVLKQLDGLKIAHSDRFAVWFINARRHLLFGEVAKALDCFSLALTIAPRSHGALCGRADCHARMNNYTKALRDLERAAEIAPAKPYIHLVRAQLIARQGDWREAVSVFSQVIELQPQNQEAWAGLGMVLSNLNKHERFLHEVEVALEEKRISPELAISQKGRILMRRRKFSEALDEFRRLVELQPDCPDSHALLSAAYRELGDLQAASAESEKALLISKRSAPALAAKGAIHLLKGETGAALYSYRLARTADPKWLGPDFAGYYRILAQCNEADIPRLGMTKKGNNLTDQNVSMAIWLNPSDPTVFIEQGEIILARGGLGGIHTLTFDPALILKADRQMAWKCFKQALTQDENSVSAHRGAAQCIFLEALSSSTNRERLLEDAIRHFGAVIKELPRDYAARFLRGLAYMELQEFRKAREDMMLAMNPILKFERNKALALINLELKEPDKAIEHALQALELDDEYFDLWITISRSYEALFDDGLAMRSLNKALAHWIKVRFDPSWPKHKGTGPDADRIFLEKGARLYVERGRLNKKRKKWKDARNDYAEAHKLFDLDAVALTEFGAVQIELGEYHGALINVQQAIKGMSSNLTNSRGLLEKMQSLCLEKLAGRAGRSGKRK